MDRLGLRPVPEGGGEQAKMGESACEVICGAPVTPAVKRKMKGVNARSDRHNQVTSLFHHFFYKKKILTS